MRLWTAISLIATAGAALAIDGGDAAAKQDSGHATCCAQTAAPRSSYLELANPPAAGTAEGKVTGKVTFEGEERPEVEPLPITEKQAQGCTKDGSLPDNTNQSVIISKEGGIKNCVIEISVKDAKVKVPEKPIELDQIQCHYDPHVILIPAGATVEFLNSDAVSHNVHTYATKNGSFNRTIAAGSKDEQKLEKSEAIQVKCDIHPWMSSYIYVTDTPYATISAADGSFTIENLPPGDYKIDVWHETLGKAKAEVKVNEDGSCEAVEIKMGEKKAGGRRRR